MSIRLHRFTPSDWHTYKIIRLEALRTDSDKFTAKHDVEVQRTDEEWIARLDPTAHWAFWGLYDGGECIGMTGVAELNEDPTGTLLIASYIRASYRGRGLSALYYQARIDWSRRGGYRYIEVGHRRGNELSKAANQKFGFKWVRTTDTLWPDGTQDDALYYHLVL